MESVILQEVPDTPKIVFGKDFWSDATEQWESLIEDIKHNQSAATRKLTIEVTVKPDGGDIEIKTLAKVKLAPKEDLKTVPYEKLYQMELFA